MFKTYKCETSKGSEYWTEFVNEMGPKVGMLLIWNYERGRADEAGLEID